MPATFHRRADLQPLVGVQRVCLPGRNEFESKTWSNLPAYPIGGRSPGSHSRPTVKVPMRAPSRRTSSSCG